MIFKQKLFFTTLVFSVMGCFGAVAQKANISPLRASTSSFMHPTGADSAWVDSVFRKMSRKERLAQLFMVPVYSRDPQKKQDSVINLIHKYKAGGIITFQGGPVRNAILINRVQQGLDIPVLVATDGEWGLGMRLDSTVSYPFQMTMGAIQDNKLIYEVGQQMAAQFKRAGMQVNFAPVIDVNNNINNPVINFRSFGENKYNVATKGAAIVKGMQDGGLLTTAKHFPGHGDTDVDSHYDLPQLKFTRERLDSLEIYPFKQLIAEGISGVMVAHMNIPALDTSKNMPSTLSKPIVTDLLKNELGFKGLVFTDAMNMKGVVKYHPKGEAAVLAIKAGNDMLEMVENLPESIKAVRKAIRKREISRKDVNARCKKILAAKYWAGLNNYQPVYLENLNQDLNPASATDLNIRLAEAAATTLVAPPDTIIKMAEKVVVLSIGSADVTVFQKNISANNLVTLLNLPKDADAKKVDAIRKQLQTADKIIVGVHDLRERPRSVLDHNSAVINLVNELVLTNKAYINILANAYTMAGFKDLEKSRGLWVYYQDSPFTERAAAKVMQGQLTTTGKLPVTVNSTFLSAQGL